MCKISQLFITSFIRANSRMQTSTDLTAIRLFSRNCEGLFQQDGALAHTLKATIVYSWTQLLSTTFRQRSGRLITGGSSHLCRSEDSVTASVAEQTSENHGHHFHHQHFKSLSVRCLTNWKQLIRDQCANYCLTGLARELPAGAP